MIIDLNNVQKNDRVYGGNAGRKLGIVYNGENWFIKFPKNMKDFRKPQRSYTTTPLSEFLGSHIYDLIGIDVHETKLCYIDNKIAVMCKDFLPQPEMKLQDFRSISNYYEIGADNSDYYNSEHDLAKLDDVIDTMDNNEYFKLLPNLKTRFWDMFVVDAFIGNNDRNQGNWGVIYNEKTKEKRIAPVYDNGASFSSTLSTNQFSAILNNPDRFVDSVVTKRICAFSDSLGKVINPLLYIKSAQNKDCNDAIVRVVPIIKAKMQDITTLIDKIPVSYNGIEVISLEQKEFYRKCLEYRYATILQPTYDKLVQPNKEKGKRNSLLRSSISARISEAARISEQINGNRGERKPKDLTNRER